MFGLGFSADSLSLADQGRKAAKRDLADGCLQLKFYGLHHSPFYSFAKLVETQLNVTVWSYGCTVWPGVPDRVQGYNEVMISEINRRFGVGILDSLSSQVEKSLTGPGRTPGRDAVPDSL
jgi:hypothetical protein